MKNLSITTLATFFTTSLLAQVGIGTASPNANSILDLTNGSNKVLMLPKTSNPSMDTIGSVYFNTTDNTLNYHDGTAYNSLSAWKYLYNGSTSLYTTENVGIGVVTPQTNLHISGNGEVLELEGSDESFLSFYPNGHGSGRKAYFGFNGSGTKDVTLNNETTTGNVIVDFTNNSDGKLDVKGKVQENGYDLVPQGLISMWSGTNIPAGWVLCDGGKYPKLIGSDSVTTPDLRERFIVGAARNGGAVFANDNVAINHNSNTDNDSVYGNFSTTYEVNQIGSNNQNAHVLSVAEMPSHRHDVNDPGHQHAFVDLHSYDQDGDNADDRTQSHTTQSNSVTSSATTGISLGLKGDNAPHENRPPYYALAFIMKL